MPRIVLAMILGSAASCGRPATHKDSDDSFASCEELGYRIEYEFDPTTLHLHQANPNWIDPTENAPGASPPCREYVGVVVQGHYSLCIVDGKLFLNNQPYGTVKKGDHLKVTRKLQVWVNGTELPNPKRNSTSW